MDSTPHHANRPASNKRKLRVLGVGRAGLNILNRLIEAGLPEAQFAAVSADADSLAASVASEKFLLESKQLRGMGSGGDPERGRAAAEEHLDRLRGLFEGVDVVFLIAGMGGGTATGAAPVLARAAKESGALVLGFASLPFDCEGRLRKRNAELGLEAFKAQADGVVCLPNQKIFKLIDQETSVAETFARTNRLLVEGIQSVWRLMSQRGLLEISFENLCTVLRDRHSESLFAVAEGAGAERVTEMLERLAAHPMFDEGRALSGAEAVLVSVAGGPELSMSEVNRIMDAIQAQSGTAELTMGACVLEGFKGRISVTLVAACPPPAKTAPTIGCAEDSAKAPEQEGLFSRLVPETHVSAPIRSRLVPTPGVSSEPSQQAASNRQGKGRKRGPRMRQGQLPLDIVSKGRFDQSVPTVLHGENLDLPTYLRRGISLN